MESTFFSRHITEATAPDMLDIIRDDIKKYNKLMHHCFSEIVKDKDALTSRKAQGLPDRRKKNLADNSAEPSLHKRMKALYHLNDYFVNSAMQSARGSLRSVKELQKLNIHDTKDRLLSSINDKIDKTEKSLSELQKCKESCISVSKYKKNCIGKAPSIKIPKGNAITYDKATGGFTIWKGRGVKRHSAKTFKDMYSFETQYLDGMIRNIKLRIRNLTLRKEHLEATLHHLEKEHVSICFGSKKLFRAQNTKYEDHAAWKRVYRKARAHGMTISGRADGKFGNFVVSYDPNTHMLTYTSMNGQKLSFRVEFPYGQDKIDTALQKQISGEERYPVAWRFEITGGSILIKCCIHVNDIQVPDNIYKVGCVGLDMNVDRIAVSTVDDNGNLLSHKVIRFNLNNKSSGYRAHILSNVLEDIFRYCHDKKLPLAIESLSSVDTTKMYGNKKLNKKLSEFSYRTMTMLALSKSLKYEVPIKTVNPAFTSQIGKIKYMKRYGISIHEAAAFAIARRAQGHKDLLPDTLKHQLDDKHKNSHHWSQWQQVYKRTKEWTPYIIYRNFQPLMTVDDFIDQTVL